MATTRDWSRNVDVSVAVLKLVENGKLDQLKRKWWAGKGNFKNWRLQEFFGRKSTFFLIYGPKDSPCSCDHFHTKLLVVGGHLRRRNPKKQPKNAINYICFVT